MIGWLARPRQRRSHRPDSLRARLAGQLSARYEVAVGPDATSAGNLRPRVEALRSGESRRNVIRGEAGIRQDGYSMVPPRSGGGVSGIRVEGIQPEMELAFADASPASLSLLGRLERLPEPRCGAQTALGLSAERHRQLHRGSGGRSAS